MYHEILHLRQNRIRKSTGHDELFYRWEHEYPYWWQVHYEYSRLTGNNMLSDKDVVLCGG